MSYDTKGKGRASAEEEDAAVEEGEEEGYEPEEELPQDGENGNGEGRSEHVLENGQDGRPSEDEQDEPAEQPDWTPKTVKARPIPPTREEREAELALLEAQAKAGQGTNDPRAKARVKPRRTVDYFGPLTRWKLLRSLASCPGQVPTIRPQPNYVIDLLPPAAYPHNSSTSYCTKYVHTSTNKIRTPVNVVRWTPEGRRVLTGSSSGEFTLWNGLTFNFETILQAHDTAVRALEWSYSGAWLVSCDNGGIIKYFQPNMNNVTLFNGHTEPIRDISFAPDDMRFVTGSDDGSVKIWDFERRELEKSMTGHGYDVRCVKWHPTKSLLVSGSKNNLIKFWDPRTGTDLRTLHDHKNTVQALSWSPNGNMVASASRDSSIKIFDIRQMRELQDLRGHARDVCSVQWHPIHSDVLVSGGSDGSLLHWNIDSPAPVDTIEFAHDSQIWGMAYHPLGHLLATGSNDHTTRWWSRGRPGNHIVNDRYHVGREKAKEFGAREDDDNDDDADDFASGALPGLQPRFPNQQFFGSQGQGGPPGGYANTSHMPNFSVPGSAPPPATIPGLSPTTGGPGNIPGLSANSGPQPFVHPSRLALQPEAGPPMDQQYGGYGRGRGGGDYRGGRDFSGRGRGRGRFDRDGGYGGDGNAGAGRFRPY